MNLRRKRLRLMRDTQWRGYARTTEGNPITLDNTLSVSKLTIQGNSTQDGTPSPDNPVMVVGTGVRTANLFGANKIKYYGYIRYDGYELTEPHRRWDELPTIQGPLDRFGVTEPLPIQPNTQYTISNFSTSNNPGFCFLAEDKETIINGDNSKDKTFTSPENAYWIVISVFLDNLNIAQLELGNTATAYEPYGYKVAVQASGQNLFEYEEINHTTDTSVEQNGNSYILSNNTYNAYKSVSFRYISLLPQTQYTMFFTLKLIDTEVENESIGDILYFKISDEKGSILNSAVYDYKNITLNTEYNTIFNFSTKDTEECTFQANLTWVNPRKTKMVISNIMIVEGTYTADTIPAYQPYKPPRTINIYTPQQINTDDYISIDVDDKTAILHADNVDTDITSLQDFTPYNLTGTWILTGIGDVPPSSLTAKYYSNERSTE